jgi:hypothetical protein
LNDRLAAELADAAAQQYALLAGAQPGFFGVTKEGRWGACFAVVRMPVDPRHGTLTGQPEILGSEKCRGELEIVNQGKRDFGLDVQKIAIAFSDRLRARSPDGAAWLIQDDYDAARADAGLRRTEREPYLSSYWLVGTAAARLSFIFGDAFKNNALVGDYFIRPFESPAGIQRAGI